MLSQNTAIRELDWSLHRESLLPAEDQKSLSSKRPRALPCCNRSTMVQNTWSTELVLPGGANGGLSNSQELSLGVVRWGKGKEEKKKKKKLGPWSLKNKTSEVCILWAEEKQDRILFLAHSLCQTSLTKLRTHFQSRKTGVAGEALHLGDAFTAT